jgi:methylenetetrahydrofolate dehydrogenase (NADP+)/methenyltetrahydrofolate cyclohydrolase
MPETLKNKFKTGINMILDGKKVATIITNEVKNKLSKEYNEPKLNIILVGEDYASKKYVTHKIKKAKEIGIKTTLHSFEDNITEKELVNFIESLNKDETVNGIFVQLPLPNHIQIDKIINTINPNKDVDGFHPINLGNLMLKHKGIKSCTPYGIMKLLQYYNISTAGKNITVIGTSNIVGKPLTNMLMNEEATVTNCNSQTKDLKSHTINADIIISATGVIQLIKADMVKEGVVIIDVGINQNSDGKLVGDVDFENIKEKCSFITPVPGGVGPLTIAMLMQNTYECFKLQSN